MSTPNFRNVNASRIYATHNEDCEDTFNNIMCDLKSRGWHPLKKYDDISIFYDGNTFMRKDKEVSIGRFFILVSVVAIIRDGYYDGYNFDWDIEIEGDSFYKASGEYSFGEENAVDMLYNERRYGIYYTMGFCRMQAKNLVNKVRCAISELSEELEKVYATYTDQLVCVGIFSNGETIYERAIAS